MKQKVVIDLQTWWMSELQKITARVMEQESKRQERVKARNVEALADYNSPDEIRDAYGYGFITEKKCDRLLEMWEQREKEMTGSELYEQKLKLLAELYEDAKRVLGDAKVMEAWEHE